MSVTDPVIVKYNEKRGMYYLLQGHETFYDADRRLLEWATAREAERYAREVLGVTALTSWPTEW